MYPDWGCAPLRKVYRIEAKTWQVKDTAGGLPVGETPSHVSAAGRALGLLLGRALSSHLSIWIIGQVALTSSVGFVQ
jgi:hypothetical protein